MPRNLMLIFRRDKDKKISSTQRPGPQVASIPEAASVSTKASSPQHTEIAPRRSREASRTSGWRSYTPKSFRRNKHKGASGLQTPALQQTLPSGSCDESEVNLAVGPAGNSLELVGVSGALVKASRGQADAFMWATPEIEELVPDNVSSTPVCIWDQVYQLLDAETREWLGSIPKTGDKPQAEQIADLVRRKEEVYKSTSPRLKVGDREIIWRDYANRVVTWVTAIGDISIKFAPAPAAPVWSVLRVLLTAHVSGCEEMTAILGFADKFLRLIRRGQVYQVIFCLDNPEQDEPTVDLRDTIVNIFKKSLETIHLAHKRLGDKGWKQLLRALVDPKEVEDTLSDLLKLEEELGRAVQTCQAVSSLATSEEHQRLLKSLQHPLRRIDEDVQRCLKTVEAVVRNDAINFISSIVVRSNHATKQDARTPNTGEWLLKHQAFQAWEESSWSSILLLKGQMGAGKSFLTSKVIDRYLSSLDNTVESETGSGHNDEGLAFFYCDRAVTERSEVTQILRSFIAQLASTSRDISKVHPKIEELFSSPNATRPGLGLEMCKSILIDLINTYPRSTLILDALDECDKRSRDDLVDVFGKLVSTARRPLKIFVSSRPEDGIRRLLGSGNLVEITTEDNREDIASYIKAQMARRADTDDNEWPASLVEKVEMTLLDKSDGMFKWVQLQWEQLLICRSPSEISSRLMALPKGLSAAYSEIYDRLEGHDQEILRRTVQWIWAFKSIGKEPKIAWLAFAVRLYDDSTHEPTDEDTVVRLGVDPDPVSRPIMDGICRHFLVPWGSRGPDKPTYKFSHASVLEYFEHHHADWFKDSEEKIAVLMMSALYECYTRWTPPEDWKRGSDWKEFYSQPFDLEDMIDPRHWLQLVIVNESSNLLLKVHRTRKPSPLYTRALIQFLGGSHPQSDFPPHIKSLKRLSNTVPYMYFPWISIEECMKPIAIACMLGSVAFLEQWLERGGDVHQEPWLLTAAIQSEVHAVYTKLISLDYDPNQKCLHGDSVSMPLNSAINRGDLTLSRILLEKGADPNDPVLYRPSLIRALYSCPELVPDLIDAGAKTEITVKGKPRSVLEVVIKDGDMEVEEGLGWLHAKGVNINPENVRYGSLLAKAAYKGCTRLVRSLIKNGAEVNQPLTTGYYGSALAAALLGWDLDIDMVKLLMTEGQADVGLLSTNPPAKPVHTYWFQVCGGYQGYQGDSASEEMDGNDVVQEARTVASYLAEDHGIDPQVLLDMGYPEVIFEGLEREQGTRKGSLILTFKTPC